MRMEKCDRFLSHAVALSHLIFFLLETKIFSKLFFKTSAGIYSVTELFAKPELESISCTARSELCLTEMLFPNRTVL